MGYNEDFFGWLQNQAPGFTGTPYLERQFYNPTQDIFSPSHWGNYENAGMPPWMKANVAPYLGYATLSDIMASQGKTDPRAFNRQLTDISRGGQAIQQGISQNLAQRGWENSGVGAALQQAAAGGTAQRRSQAIAQENALAEQRKREDLDLLLKLFVSPGIDYSAIESGQYQANAQRKADQQSAYLNMIKDIAALFGGAAS